MRDIYIVDYNRVVVDFDVNDDESEISVSFNIDMRKIKKPSDIDKYIPQVVNEAVAEYRRYYNYTNDVNAAQEFMWNPYELGPEDPEEPEEIFNTEEEFEINIDTIIAVRNADEWEYESTDWAAQTDRGWRWISENYPEFELMDNTSVIEAVDELLLPYIPAIKGRYQLKAKITLHVDESDIVYWNEDDGYDFSSAKYNINMNKSTVDAVDVRGI